MKIRRAQVLAMLACLCTASVAGAQPTNAQQAKEHFKRGELLDREQDYASAIREYSAAYQLAPHPDVLFNIAVDHEHLQHWQQAADMFQRYLDERDDQAADAAAVTARIKDLRAKVPVHTRVRPAPPPDPTPEPTRPPPQTIEVQPQPIPEPQQPARPQVVIDQQPPQPTSPLAGVQFSHWHVAGSYGIADGTSPSERYQGRVGYDLARYVDLDAVAGTFGNNDYALGGLVRIVVAPNLAVQPFILGAATIGIAKQDASSRAGTRAPVGFEAGGGVQFGKHGHIELDVVLRYLTGGWGSSETTAFSYANDTMAIGIDLGIGFDFPTTLGQLGQH